MAQHTQSNEYCIECDAAYRSYGCMISPDSEKKSPNITELLENLAKSAYECGQQDPRPYSGGIAGLEIVTDDPKFGEVTSVFSFRNDSNGYYGGWIFKSEPDKSAPEITDDVLEAKDV
jgi:hypothetical protein